MSKQLTTVTPVQPTALATRFTELRQRLADPLAVGIESARSELDKRILEHLNFRVTKILDAMVGDED